MLNSAMVSMDEAVPYSLVMAFIPQMIADSVVLGLDSNDPENEKFLISAAEMQGIKLLSSFDLSDSFHANSLHAMYPWKHPKGYFLSLYFPYLFSSDNPAPVTLDGAVTIDRLMLMIGIVIHRAYANIINLGMDKAYRIMEEFKEPVLDAFNRNCVLILKHLEARSALPLAMNGDNENLNPVRNELKKIMGQLRTRFQHVIREWLTDLE